MPLPCVAFLTVQHLWLKASKKLPLAPPSSPGLAAHLRYRRESLGLTRAQAAEQIGVRGAAVGLWETGEHHPESPYWPGILRFIGYDPICPDPQTVPEKIAYLCRHMGISRTAVAGLVDVNKTTILKWEGGRNPQRKSMCAKRLDQAISALRAGRPLELELPHYNSLAEI